MTVEKDLHKISNKISCRHKEYEINRVTHLENQIAKSVASFELNNNVCSQSEIVCFTQRVLPVTKKLGAQLQLFREFLNTTSTSLAKIDKMASCTVGHCNRVLQAVRDFDLHPVKPRKADFTDAGPGVAVNNLEIKFRDAELAIVHNYDYRIRCHKSRGDSGQGEAERTNSAMGDALVDGATIEWEAHKRFEGMPRKK